MDRLDWPLRWLSVLLAGLVFTLTLRTGSLAPPASLIVCQALLITLVSFLLLPPANGPAGLFANCAAGAAVLIPLVLLPFAGRVPAIVVLQVSLVIYCLSLILWSLAQLMQALFPGWQHVRNTVSLLAAGIVAAPVWLGPFVERYMPGESTVNSIVSITPLTHLAVAARYDYLRADWFYQNSPFGSLPFAYPDLLSIVAAYLILSICLQLVRRWKTGRRWHPDRTQSNKFVIS